MATWLSGPAVAEVPLEERDRQRPRLLAGFQVRAVLSALAAQKRVPRAFDTYSLWRGDASSRAPGSPGLLVRASLEIDELRKIG